MLTVRHPIIGTERRRLAKARQRLVIRRQEVLLAERRRLRAQFVSRTRLSPGQLTKVTQHQAEVVGKVTSLRQVMVITSGHGQVSVRKDKDPLHLDPRHQVKVALDLCRHRRKDSGRPVKVPRVYVHRLHPTQEIGGQDGDHLPVMVMDRPQLSRRARQHRDAGFTTLVVMCVDSQVVIAVFMDQMLCRHKHPQVCDALCVASGDATHPVIRLEFRH